MLSLTACTKSSITSNTVMITNLAGNSGGSGTIVNSSPGFSQILTNGHVCQVVKNGGRVVTDSGESHFVISYKVSNNHDLCLLAVADDLHASASLSTGAPRKYSSAIVSGHPRLLPTIVTSGHFSSKMLIPVFTGVRPCTLEDAQNPEFGMFCLFYGGIPIIKVYESIVVSATIQPGSSGSAVYDQAGNISAVIFAGSGDIGYGFAVPYEYVKLFLEVEAPRLEPQIPNVSMFATNSRERREEATLIETLQRLCNLKKNNSLLCDTIRDLKNTLIQ